MDGSLEGDGTPRLESSSHGLEKRDNCSSRETWSLLKGVNLLDFARPGKVLE